MTWLSHIINWLNPLKIYTLWIFDYQIITYEDFWTFTSFFFVLLYRNANILDTAPKYLASFQGTPCPNPVQFTIYSAMCILLIVQWHTIASISTMGVVRESCFVFAERICNLNFCISPLFVQLPVSVPFIMLLHMNILLLQYL